MRRGITLLFAVLVAAAAIGCGADDEATTGIATGENGTTTGIENGQRVDGSDQRAEINARTAATAMEVYVADHGGNYTGADTAALRRIEQTLPPNLAVQVRSSGYSVTIPAKLSGTRFTVEKRLDGTLSFTCSSPGTGDCPPSGDWGS